MGIFTKHPYRKKYYLTHPIEFFAHYYRDLECAYQRATKGYCYRDLWSIDYWFLDLFPRMLNEFNQIRNGYPADVSDEQWDEILNDMIKYFKNANEDTTDFINKYSEQWDKMISTKWIKWEKTEDGFYQLSNEPKTSEEEELSKNFYEEENKKFEYMKENLHKGLELFEKYFYALWD